eukprot:TRINITY_DN2695_c0_g1_i4.p1 TRINITY_DN2695_c0_g1~~TRINITY_DN2695_c0_g1_i4.p1  ORF type:complete len:131 (-),score=0.49 TRINITY_DN2695_c0_g1_i4:84-476(-)
MKQRNRRLTAAQRKILKALRKAYTRGILLVVVIGGPEEVNACHDFMKWQIGGKYAIVIVRVQGDEQSDEVLAGLELILRHESTDRPYATIFLPQNIAQLRDENTVLDDLLEQLDRERELFFLSSERWCTL